MTKDHVLAVLAAAPGEYVSGEDLAARLGVSRTAVWKAVEQLRSEGYPIESVPRRGHRLSPRGDVLSEEGIRRYLRSPDVRLQVLPTVTSTNTLLKQMAAEDAPAGTALAAGEQTAGRGRLGRSFYSPAGTGLYMSLLLRPDLAVPDAALYTTCAAVCAAEAIEELAGVSPDVKWVNDLYLGGRKICGILTEAGMDCESGRVSYVIIGIGINTRIPEGDFPEDIRDMAGAVFGDDPVPDLRNRLAAGILDRLMARAAAPDSDEIFEAYRRRSLAPGRPVLVLTPGQDPVPAEAVCLERDYALRVRLESGEERLLRSGEISIRFRAEES